MFRSITHNSFISTPHRKKIVIKLKTNNNHLQAFVDQVMISKIHNSLPPTHHKTVTKMKSPEIPIGIVGTLV